MNDCQSSAAGQHQYDDIDAEQHAWILESWLSIYYQEILNKFSEFETELLAK